MPRHRRPPRHRRCCMSKQGTDADAKAPSSASMPTCVAPTSNHCPPPHLQHRCRLSQHVRDSQQSRGTIIRPATDSSSCQQTSIVICPATNLLARQQARDGQRCQGTIVRSATKPSSRKQASTIIQPAANLLLRQRASTAICPAADSLSRQQASSQKASTAVRPAADTSLCQRANTTPTTDSLLHQ